MTTRFPADDIPKYVVRLEHIYVRSLKDINIKDLKYIYVEDLMNKKKKVVKKLKLNKKTNFKVLHALLNDTVCWVEFEYQIDDLNYLIPICKKVDSDSELKLCVKVKVKNPTLEDILESEDFVPTDKMLIAIKQRYKELFDTDTDLIYNGPIINSTTPNESSRPLSKSVADESPVCSTLANQSQISISTKDSSKISSINYNPSVAWDCEPHHVAFLNSYDVLLKDKKPFNKYERVYFSSIYFYLNNRAFLDNFWRLNQSLFQNPDSYYCSYEITNKPYKQMTLIKTLFLSSFTLKQPLDNFVHRLDKTEIDIHLSFDLLRLAVCQYVMGEEEVDFGDVDLINKIYSNFLKGLKIYNPLSLAQYKHYNQTINNDK